MSQWPRTLLLALLLVVARGAAAAPPVNVHGATDAYAGHGITLAWAVLRGADEMRTQVILRVERAANAPGFVAVVGIDPFTQARQSLLAPAPIGAGLAVRSPRSRFADLPRTELRFYSDAAAAAADAPVLVVFYLGVPDTTPEFTDERKLDADVAARLARVRNAGPRP